MPLDARLWLGPDRPSAQAAKRTALQAGDIIVRVDPRYFRPTEVATLLGNASKARTQLGWHPKILFEELVAEMVREDLQTARRDDLVTQNGYKAFTYPE